MDVVTYALLIKKIRESGGDISGLIADVEALEKRVQQLANALVNLGVTSTPLTDGANTNPIVINGESVIAPNNGFVAYGSKEFLFNGTIWQEFGDVTDVYTKAEADARFAQQSSLGTAASKDSTNAVTEGSTDLVESGAVKTAIDAAIAAITDYEEEVFPNG